MTDFPGKLSNVGDLLGMGGDAVLTVLAGIVEGIGTGTEFTGEQLDRLGELQQALAEKIKTLRGE